MAVGGPGHGGMLVQDTPRKNGIGVVNTHNTGYVTRRKTDGSRTRIPNEESRRTGLDSYPETLNVEYRLLERLNPSEKRNHGITN